MIDRHHVTKHPTGAGFSWGRGYTPATDDTPGTVTYRLFRRDHRRCVHCRMLQFRDDVPRGVVSVELRLARHRLRNKVVEIDLAAMGITNDQERAA